VEYGEQERCYWGYGDHQGFKHSPVAWTLARVIEVYPGKDGLVRAVKLRASSGEIVRPIFKEAILPNSET